eukprot:jgi/Botrbrau1/859/Bobra.0352s0052.1
MSSLALLQNVRFLSNSKNSCHQNFRRLSPNLTQPAYLKRKNNCSMARGMPEPVRSGSSDTAPVLKFKTAKTDDGSPYTPVLALDGGGLRGIITACVLEELETVIKEVAVENKLVPEGQTKPPGDVNDFNVDLSDYFPIVAGTSAGAIAATYLAQKGAQAAVLNDADVIKAAQVLAHLKTSVYKPKQPFQPTTRPGAAASLTAVFLSKGAVIFPPADFRTLRSNINNFIASIISCGIIRCFLKLVVCILPRALVQKTWGIFGAKHPSTGIDAVLQESFGSNFKLSQFKPEASLIIVSYDVLRNRPIVFFFDATAEPEERSGFATIRRYVTKKSVIADEIVPGTFSGDIVRIPEDFYVWQSVRASTAAPTFFPTASVNSLLQPTEAFQLCDGGVIANNPTLVAMTFALSIYTQELERVSSLSIGTGTTNQMLNIPQDAGLAAWGLSLATVLMGGPTELTDALARQIGSELLGGVIEPMYIKTETAVEEAELQRRNHFRRIQITADEIEGENNTKQQIIVYNGTRVTVEQFLDGQTLSAPPAAILAVFDNPAYGQDLIKIGYLLAKEPTTRTILKEFAKSFLLEIP